MKTPPEHQDHEEEELPGCWFFVIVAIASLIVVSWPNWMHALLKAGGSANHEAVTSPAKEDEEISRHASPWATVPVVVGALVIYLLSGCTGLDGYTRSYTVSVEDEGGRKASVGITLQPNAKTARRVNPPALPSPPAAITP